MSNARATLKHLLRMFACPHDVSAKKPPDLIHISVMGGAETWLWWRVGPPAGLDSLYEMRDE
jgi:hypothetical protein